MRYINEIEAFSILSGTPLLGSIKIQMLVRHFGSAQTALNASPEEIGELPGFTPRILQHWGWWETDSAWERNLEIAEQFGVKLIPYTGQEYPKELRKLPDPPILLYMKGELRRSDQLSISIVGTRYASIYGMETGEKISQDLASMGFTVVSGLARGIDTAAHRGALKSGRTVAIIGSGLANIYPRENGKLAEEIEENGALISEFPMKTPPDRQNFPQRNRIVSQLSLGTLLIEAPEKSGAMITMNKAYSQEKKLFAIPGRVDCDHFRGNHLLIKKGKAHLVENAQDIEKSFGTLFTFNKQQPETPKKPILEKEETELLNFLPNEELSIEKMVYLTKLPVRKINILLMSLKLKRAIKEFPGKIYKKC